MPEEHVRGYHSWRTAEQRERRRREQVYRQRVKEDRAYVHCPTCLAVVFAHSDAYFGDDAGDITARHEHQPGELERQARKELSGAGLKGWPLPPGESDGYT